MHTIEDVALLLLFVVLAWVGLHRLLTYLLGGDDHGRR